MGGVGGKAEEKSVFQSVETHLGAGLFQQELSPLQSLISAVV